MNKFTDQVIKEGNKMLYTYICADHYFSILTLILDSISMVW